MFYAKSKTGLRLSAEEEAGLALLVQKKGDIEARNKLVMANLGLVYFVANQMFRPYLRREDLLQEGLLGLMRASETFRPDRQIRFSTYGVFWVRAKIQQCIHLHDRERLQQISGFSIESLPAGLQNPEEQILQDEKTDTVRQILKRVAHELKNPKLSQIIQYRILAEEPESLEKLGQRLGVSRETCRLLESKMLKLAREELANWRF